VCVCVCVCTLLFFENWAFLCVCVCECVHFVCVCVCVCTARELRAEQFIYSVYTKDSSDEKGQARDIRIHFTLYCSKLDKESTSRWLAEIAGFLRTGSKKRLSKGTFDLKGPKLNALIRDKISFVGGTWLVMICRCPTNADDGKLLVRASATILCVHEGTSLINPARTSSHTKYYLMSMWRENFLCTGFSLIAMQARLSS